MCETVKIFDFIRCVTDVKLIDVQKCVDTANEFEQKDAILCLLIDLLSSYVYRCMLLKFLFVELMLLVFFYCNVTKCYINC